MKLSKYIVSSLMLLFSVNAVSQSEYYAVYFKDKGDVSKLPAHNCISMKTQEKRMKNGIAIDYLDYPINQRYVDILTSDNCKIVLKSKWLNCVVVEVNGKPEFYDYQFVSKVTSIKTKSVDSLDYKHSTYNSFLVLNEENSDNVSGNEQLELVRGTALHNEGFYGRDVTIAIMDDGFLRADKVSCLKHVFDDNRVVHAENLIDNNNIYNCGAGHGSQIFSILAADASNLMGAAPEASYMLFKTEDPFNESLLEEYAWVNAAEIADSLGVDVISSSLNYSLMNDASQSHTYNDMDGKTCPISIGANIAAKKGIIVVVSAGNDGSSVWKYISAPADAENVVTVGAVSNQGDRWFASSVGPTADGRIKPDLCALGINVNSVNPISGNIISQSGTSFATPVVAGFFACMLNAFPDTPSANIQSVVYNTSSNTSVMNNEVGRGIPDFAKAYSIVGIAEDELSFLDYKLYPNPFVNEFFISHRNDIASVKVFTSDGKQLKADVIDCGVTNVSIKINSTYKGLMFIIVKTKDGSAVKFVAIKK